MDEKFIIIQDDDTRPFMFHCGGTKYGFQADTVVSGKRCGLKLSIIAIQSKQDTVISHILNRIGMGRLATKFKLIGAMFDPLRPLSSIYKLNITCGEFNTLFHLVMSVFEDHHELLASLGAETQTGEISEALYLEFANMLKEHYDVVAEAKTRI